MDVRTVWGAREGCQRDGSAGGRWKSSPGWRGGRINGCCGLRRCNRRCTSASEQLNYWTTNSSLSASSLLFLRDSRYIQVSPLSLQAKWFWKVLLE